MPIGAGVTTVVRTALQDAASIASLMRTNEALVSGTPEKTQDVPAAGAGGMGGMY